MNHEEFLQSDGLSLPRRRELVEKSVSQIRSIAKI